MSRRLAAVILLAVGVVALSACAAPAPGGEPTDAPPSTSSEPATVDEPVEQEERGVTEASRDDLVTACDRGLRPVVVVDPTRIGATVEMGDVLCLGLAGDRGLRIGIGAGGYAQACGSVTLEIDVHELVTVGAVTEVSRDDLTVVDRGCWGVTPERWAALVADPLPAGQYLGGELVAACHGVRTVVVDDPAQLAGWVDESFAPAVVEAGTALCDTGFSTEGAGLGSAGWGASRRSASTAGCGNAEPSRRASRTRPALEQRSTRTAPTRSRAPVPSGNFDHREGACRRRPAVVHGASKMTSNGAPSSRGCCVVSDSAALRPRRCSANSRRAHPSTSLKLPKDLSVAYA